MEKIYIFSKALSNTIGNFNSGVQTAFVVLKLTNLVDWPWWVVLMPLWVGLVVATPALIYGLYLYHRAKKRLKKLMG